MPRAPRLRQRSANALTSGKLRPRELRSRAILLMLTESLVISLAYQRGRQAQTLLPVIACSAGVEPQESVHGRVADDASRRGRVNRSRLRRMVQYCFDDG